MTQVLHYRPSAPVRTLSVGDQVHVLDEHDAVIEERTITGVEGAWVHTDDGRRWMQHSGELIAFFWNRQPQAMADRRVRAVHPGDARADMSAGVYRAA